MKIDGGIRIQDEAAPYLTFLAQTFPSEFRRALRHAGWWLRTKVASGIRSDGREAGQDWGQRSMISMYRPFARLARSQFKKRWKNDATHKAGNLATALTSASPLTRSGFRVGRDQGFGSGKMLGGVRYAMQPGRMEVRVGFLGGAGGFASMLQQGRLGALYRWPFRRRQAVTPAMRRMFWAAGVPLAKNTTVIESEPRPLIEPVYERNRQEVARRIEARVYGYLEKTKKRAKRAA